MYKVTEYAALTSPSFTIYQPSIVLNSSIYIKDAIGKLGQEVVTVFIKSKNAISI